MHKYVVAFLSLFDCEMKMKHYMADTAAEALTQCLNENKFNMQDAFEETPELAKDAELIKDFAYNSDCFIEFYRVS